MSAVARSCHDTDAVGRWLYWAASNKPHAGERHTTELSQYTHRAATWRPMAAERSATPRELVQLHLSVAAATSSTSQLSEHSHAHDTLCCWFYQNKRLLTGVILGVKRKPRVIKQQSMVADTLKRARTTHAAVTHPVLPSRGKQTKGKEK